MQQKVVRWLHLSFIWVKNNFKMAQFTSFIQSNHCFKLANTKPLCPLNSHRPNWYLLVMKFLVNRTVNALLLFLCHGNDYNYFRWDQVLILASHINDRFCQKAVLFSVSARTCSSLASSLIRKENPPSVSTPFISLSQISAHSLNKPKVQ